MITIFTLLGCKHDVKKGNELTKSETEFIKGLGILGENESIIQFHSQSGESDEVKQAGNFYSDKRIAAYWIDDKDTSRTKINSAFYNEIDTIITKDNSNDWTLGSYLKIRTKDGNTFKVYISGNKDKTSKFFNGAIKEWESKKTPLNIQKNT